MNRIKKHIAFFLLLVSTLFIVPKSLVHELTAHRDTVDIRQASSHGLVIETPHHHCAILKCFFQPYHFDGISYFISECKILPEHYSDYNHHFVFHHKDVFANKGPPTYSLV